MYNYNYGGDIVTNSNSNKVKMGRIIADIPKEAHREIKKACATRGQSISDVTKLALREYLQLELTNTDLGINNEEEI